MGGVKHMMDEVAARMGIDDPNDERVKAEVDRLLSELKEKDQKPEVKPCPSL
jgi:hypothetical protein